MIAKNSQKAFNTKQLLFKEIFVGTLIYVVVLGFLNDYTDIVYAKSFSTIFFASLVLQILTNLAFLLKNNVVRWLKNKTGAVYKILMFFFIWLIMFLSKFVFIWALDLVFSDYININGFFGILLVVILVTLIHKSADYMFAKLGEDK